MNKTNHDTILAYQEERSSYFFSFAKKKEEMPAPNAIPTKSIDSKAQAYSLLLTSILRLFENFFIVLQDS